MRPKVWSDCCCCCSSCRSPQRQALSVQMIGLWNTESRRNSSTTSPGLWSGRKGHKTRTAKPSSSGSLGEDPFGPILESIIRGKNVGGKRLRVKRMEHLAEESGGCHLLFISRSQTERLPEILRRVQGRSVLTVGDSEGSARRGTVISFLIEDETVQFEVNLQAAERAGIKISSRLLRVARIVGKLP